MRSMGARQSLLQFSLRSLHVLFVPIALWLGLRVNKVRSIETAIRTVKESGGWLTYGYPQDDRRGNTLSDPTNRPEWLKVLIGYGEYDKVASVYLRDRDLRKRDPARFVDDESVVGKSTRRGIVPSPR